MAVNNELCGTQSKGRIKKRMYQFWHTLLFWVDEWTSGQVDKLTS